LTTTVTLGAINLVDSNADRETWFWGVSFDLTHRKSYGHVARSSPKRVLS